MKSRRRKSDTEQIAIEILLIPVRALLRVLLSVTDLVKNSQKEFLKLMR